MEKQPLKTEMCESTLQGIKTKKNYAQESKKTVIKPKKVKSNHSKQYLIS